MENVLKLEIFIRKDQEGQYLTLPFQMPPDTETFSLSYRYERHQERVLDGESAGFTQRQEVNIIDLGLIHPNGTQVGASGSNKTEIEIDSTHATPGYQLCDLVPGEWQILVGAYKVADAGVKVFYELSFRPKCRRLLKGDLHVHTYGSDGVHSVEELGQRAIRHGLDFLAITDHNQMVSAESLPQIPGVTLIPGIEWSHFQGHANFLGVDRPYDEPYFARSFEEVLDRFTTARERGALITINHPFEEECPFQFDLHSLPFDCLEVWNGPMRESNLRAMGLWQQLLLEGKKVPICGGSDYHRDQLFIFPGGPTTCVFASSASVVDILSALKQGHAYVVFAPDGPSLEMVAGGAVMGDSVTFSSLREFQVTVDHLLAGDVLQVVTAQGNEPVFKAESGGRYAGSYVMESPGFARVEVWRGFVPGLPLLPALISNPIYFVEE